MQFDIVSFLFSSVLQVDLAQLACIVCNWDPETGSYVPYVPAAGAAGAAAAGVGSAGVGGAQAGTSNTYPDGTPRLGQPVNPDLRQQVPPGSPPPPPGEYFDRSDMDGRVAAEEAERQRARDSRHARHPEDSTAPPPGGLGDRAAETAADAFYHSFFTLGKR